MSLEIQFKIEKGSLLCQENPRCQLVIANTGNGSVQVANPEQNPNVPVLRVVDVKTGIETRQHGVERHAGTTYQALEPDKKIQHDFALNTIASLPLPVEYEISAIVPYDMGAKRAESKPVRIKLFPVTPRGLAYSHVQGAWAAIQYGVSINAASDPPQIVRHRFHVMAEGGVADARPVANAPLRAAPVLSVAPVQSVAHSHWIAWVDEGALVFTHFDPLAGGALTPARWKPAEPEFVPVAPLASEPVPDSGARPAGAALVWVGDAGRHLSAFQVVQFSPNGKATAGARCDLAGPRPVWMMNHVRSDGTRLVTFALDHEKGASLWIQPWPKPGSPGEARRLAEWQSRCLGGGASIGEDDVIRGASLVRASQRTDAKLEIISWQVDVENRFAERERHSIEWGFTKPIVQNVVRVGPGGSPVALLEDEMGKWHFFEGEDGLKPLPAAVATSRLPLDLTFLSESQVVLIAGQLTQGFKLMMANGDSLPHKCG